MDDDGVIISLFIQLLDAALTTTTALLRSLSALRTISAI